MNSTGAAAADRPDPPWSDRLEDVQLSMLGGPGGVGDAESYYSRCPGWRPAGRHPGEERKGISYRMDGMWRFHCALGCNEVTAGFVERPPPLPLTDSGNAERLVARHGRDLRFCHPWSAWVVWDGKRWKRDATAEVMRRAKDTARAIHHEAGDELDDKSRKPIADWARKSEAKDKRVAMVSLASCEAGIPILPEQLDTDPWLFNVANGTIDLRTGTLREHRRADLISRLSPVHFDPNANCPAWDRFLLEVMDGDAELVAFLQRAAGYTLTGDVGAHVLFFAHGAGRNGKSTALSTMLALLGEYGKAAAPDLLLAKKGDQIPVDQADLFGCRLAVCQEVEEGRRFAEVTVKHLTGGDSIKARFMRQDFFQFEPTHKIFLAANHKPRVRGTDEGIWSRILLIPFTVTIRKEKRDPALKQKLAAELPGILAWAVRGTMAWQEGGCGLAGLAAPPKVQQATDEYREAEDLVGRWIEDACIPAAVAFTTTKALHESHVAWCERNGERPVAKNSFGERLRARGFQPHNTGAARGWLGLRLDPTATHTRGHGTRPDELPLSVSHDAGSFSRERV